MKKLFKELNIELTSYQEEQFNKYYSLLMEENEKYNLTAIKNYEEVLIKHFYDSLTLVLIKDFNEVNTLCDVGTGAGFPGIPLKIVYPHLKLTLVESVKKKTMFLNLLVDELNLNDVNVVNKRAEDFAKQNNNKFDLVTARAVSPLNILIELCIPLVKSGKNFIAMKASSYKNELNEAKDGIMILESFLIDTIKVDLPNNLGTRNLLKFKKNKHVKGYPRTYAQIKKKPL